jgi:hypothetical protein
MADRSLRCSVQARSLGYRPAGTAASAAAFVLVEAPLPWPADVADHPQLAPLAPVLAAHGARLQGLVPGDPGDSGAGRDPEARRVVVYRQDQPDGVVGPYVRRERVTDADHLVDTVAELLSAPLPDLHAGPDGDIRDVLVCTHGSRDVCCGSAGIGVFRDLGAARLPGVRVWRTSHTGGHRFAPTALTFPDGRAWAWVDAGLLAGIVTRSVPATEAARHDRGTAALPDPFTQAADAAVLAVEGWDWLSRPRVVEVTAADGDHRTVTLSTPPAQPGPLVPPASPAPAGGPPPVGYQAEVAVKRVVPVPDCGRPLDQARKSHPEVDVVALARR